MLNDSEIHVLVVDDDEMYRNSLVFGLGRHFKVDGCGNLEDAKKLIDTNTYDVLLTDGAFPVSGNHIIHNPTDKDFNGNLLAGHADAHNVKLIIGMSSEPQKLKECHAVFKKPIDIVNMIAFIRVELQMRK